MKTRRSLAASTVVLADKSFSSPRTAARFGWHFSVILFGATVLVSGGAVWISGNPGQSERETLVKLARRNVPTIGDRLTMFVTQHPQDAEVVELLVAWHLREKSSFDIVEPILGRLCELRPHDSDPWRTRAILRGRNGRPEEALSDGLRVLELSPEDHETRKLVIAVATECGQSEVALREARILYDSEGLPRRESGTILVKTCLAVGDVPRALEIVDECFPPSGADADGQALRAQVFQAGARHEEATILYRSLVEHSVVYREFALFRLSQSLAALKRDEEATAILAELERVKSRKRTIVDAAQRPDDRDAQIRSAEILLEDGRANEAVGVLERAIVRFGRDSSLVSLLARAQRNAGRSEVAEPWERQDSPLK